VTRTDWPTIPVELVPVRDLDLDGSVYLGDLAAPPTGDRYAHLVAMPDGRLVIHSGHVHVARAVVTGRRRVGARVLRGAA